MWLTGAVWACAFLIGYSINQGGTCAVAASHELIHARGIRLFAGFAVATGAAGMIALPLAWATGAHVPGSVALDLRLVAGSMLLGLGAVANDACMLGSLWRLGNGELRIALLPLGLAAGFVLPTGIAPHVAPNPFATPTPAAWLAVTAFGVVLVVAALLLGRIDRVPEPPGRWPLRYAMTLLGAGGALLYVLQPGWTYADAVKREVAPAIATMMTMSGGAILAAVLVVTGAVVSAIRLKVFQPRLPSPVAALRTFAGGALMAFGAVLIPGGNDTLLLSSVPSASLSGATAYTVMTATVLVLVWLFGERVHLRVKA